MNVIGLSERFKNFAENECNESSPLYEYLSLKISKDKEILELTSHTRKGQPVPNLFLGAIHYLLLKGKKHILQEYYPSLVEQPRELEHIFPHFKDFCHLYKHEIISLLKNKFVQTNEVRRCSYLYPSFSYIYNKVKKPLSLIEIETSAGLLLIWDQYSYSYGNNITYGNKNSEVHITSEIKGDRFPLLLENSPPVLARIGLDLHICDLTDPENILWLQSLIWPEHRYRLDLFEKAAHNYTDHPVKLIEGDGVALVKEIAKQIPEETAICIFHTHVANQMSKATKLELLENIKEIGNQRDVFHLYNNIWDGYLHLDYFINGVEHNHTIGEADGHGRWFYWGLP